MKSPLPLVISAALLLGAILQGCGQTGPLYMPKAPARAAGAISPLPDPVTVPPTTDNGIPTTIPAQNPAPKPARAQPATTIPRQ